MAETLGPPAFYGLVGEIVRAIEPFTEADSVGLVICLLTMLANMVGPGQYLSIGNVRHGFNLFVALIGATAKSRKNTAEGEIESLMAEVDPVWASERIQEGLSSGEGLIYAVRDAAGDDPGVSDKRLMDVESEFAGMLAVMKRVGNTLCSKLRALWDGRKKMTVLTRRFPLVATGAFVSLIVATTLDDLKHYLGLVDVANGFSNRFLFVLLRRRKLLPNPEPMPRDQRRVLVARLKDAAGFARNVRRIRLSPRAQELWERHYVRLTAETPGILGAVTSRSEVQVLRMAGVYALIDKSDLIRIQHLKAALEVWRYCFDSARLIFGGRSVCGVEDRLLKFLRSSPRGLTLTEIATRFSNHSRTEQISDALHSLRDQGLAFSRRTETSGRPATRWTATSEGKAKEPNSRPEEK